MKIAIDIDEVLMPFMVHALPFFNSRNGTSLQLSDFTHMDAWIAAGFPLEHCVKEMRAFYETEEFKRIEPYPKAVPMVQALKEAGHELTIITGRYSNAQPHTRAWIERFFPGMFEEVLFTSYRNHEGENTSKASLCKERGIRLLIEDDVHYVDQCLPEGVQVILIANVWNAKETRVPVVTWEAVPSNIADRYE